MSTRIFLVDCTPLTNPEQLEKALPLLDFARRQRIARLRSPLGQAQQAAAELLMTRFVGGGKPPVLTFGEHGKPYAAEKGAPQFNLSHSGRFVLCALSNEEVGLDAQLQGPSHPRVARRYFTAEELQWMQEQPDERFTRLWAAKEAYGKMSGRGLSEALKTVPLLPQSDGWDAKLGCCRSEQMLVRGEETLWVAVCAHECVPIEMVTEISVDELLP